MEFIVLEFKVFTYGPFSPKTVFVAYDNSEFTFEDRQQALIETIWNETIATAQVKGANIFNGRLFRLRNWKNIGGQLHLYLENTDYKCYVGTRSTTFHAMFKNAEMANPLAVCIAIVTVDNHVLIERRKAVDVYAGRYHVIGGFMDQDYDLAANLVPDPFAAVAREAHEELGIHLEYESVQLLGLVYDLATPHPELCFSTDVPYSFRDVETCVKYARTDGEVKRIEGISSTAKKLRNFILENHGRISATGEPCLLLYGRHTFGEGWYREMMEALSIAT
jgi:8-oxo-dGTP pyrophosphatase MutT (NUDIX family)